MVNDRKDQLGDLCSLADHDATVHLHSRLGLSSTEQARLRNGEPEIKMVLSKTLGSGYDATALVKCSDAGDNRDADCRFGLQTYS